MRIGIVAALAVVMALVVACSTDAAPEQCIEAAEEAGAPEVVIDFLRRPSDDLNALERIAIREALERLGLNETCGAVKDKLS